MSIVKNILAQMDAELLWIAQESADNVFKGRDTVRRIEIVEAVAKQVGQTLCERRGETVKESEFISMARDVFFKLSAEERGAGTSYLAERICEACVAYLELRTLGIKTAYAPQMIYSDYNPFANEGGFCYPIKLKLLYDD
jgi:hypothetical protein